MHFETVAWGICWEPRASRYNKLKIKAWVFRDCYQLNLFSEKLLYATQWWNHSGWLYDDVMTWKRDPNYGPFVWRSASHRRFPLAKSGDAEFWCFFDVCLNKYLNTWWRHQIETFSALQVICPGNSPVTGEFPAQRPVTLSFDVFFDLRLNKRLSKHSWGWWCETPWRPLWRHCNEAFEFSAI